MSSGEQAIKKKKATSQTSPESPGLILVDLEFETASYGDITSKISLVLFSRMGCSKSVPSHLFVVELFGFLVWVAFQLRLGLGEWGF